MFKLERKCDCCFRVFGKNTKTELLYAKYLLTVARYNKKVLAILCLLFPHNSYI